MLRRRRPDPFLVAGAAIVVAHLVFRGWALWGSWFHTDDLAFTSRALNRPFDVDFLVESYAGHLMPAGFAVTRVLVEHAAFEWWAWGGTLLVLHAGAAIGMFRLLVSMFGRRPLVLGLLALYLSWVFTLPAGVWFAAGINQLPMQIALTFGLAAHLAYLRDRRTRHLLAALAWTVFGLAFYEKVLLVFPVYGLVALGWFATGSVRERFGQLWSTYRTGLVAHVVLAAGYVAAYLRWGWIAGTEDGARVPWGDVLANYVLVTLVPALAGGPLTWAAVGSGSIADPSLVMVVVGFALLVGVVLYADHTRTLSRRAWLLLGATVVANLGLLATGRAWVVGAEIAREYRYQTELAAVAVLSIGLAFLPLRGAVEVNAPREGVARPYERRRVVGALTLTVVVLAVVSSVRYVDSWQVRNPTKEYFANLRAAMAEQEEPLPLVNSGLPHEVMWSFNFPENTHQYVLRPYADELSFPTSAVGDLFMFDEEGHAAPVEIERVRRAEPIKGCGYKLADDRSTTVPLDGPLIGGWWVQLDYRAREDAQVTVSAGDSEHDLALPAGKHSVYFYSEGEFERLRVSGDDGAGVCVSKVVVGSAQPGR